MSLMAMVWAMHLAPVPLQRNGRRHTPSVAVLIALADRTGSDDGSDAFPSVPTLSTITGLSERHVQTCLQKLVEAGAIRLSRAPIVAVKIARADKRPQSYDLDLTAVRYDLTEGELQHIERTVPLLRPHVQLMRAAREQAAAEGRWVRNDDGLDDVGEELEDLAEAVGNPRGRGARGAGRGEPRSPREAHGVNVVPARGERGSERGEPRSPEPLQEPLQEPLPRAGGRNVSPGGRIGAVDNSDADWRAAASRPSADPVARAAEARAALGPRRRPTSSEQRQATFLESRPAYEGRERRREELAALLAAEHEHEEDTSAAPS